MAGITHTLLLVSLWVSLVCSQTSSPAPTPTSTPTPTPGVTSTDLGTGMTKSNATVPTGPTTALSPTGTKQVSHSGTAPPTTATSPTSGGPTQQPQRTTSAKPATGTSSPSSPQGSSIASDDGATTANTSQTTPAQSTAKTLTATNSMHVSQNVTETVFPKSNLMDPGLVAVIVILVSLLIIALVFTMVRFCHPGQQNFKRLHDLPMNSLSEDAPFAHYPPK